MEIRRENATTAAKDCHHRKNFHGLTLVKHVQNIETGIKAES